jgi:Na+-translocating ferredoxin:NAD+ oxidoreductase RnfA subunit
MSVLYVVMVYGLKYLRRDKLEGIRISLIYSCFNCAVLGAMLLSAAQGYNFAKTIGLGLEPGWVFCSPLC